MYLFSCFKLMQSDVALIHFYVWNVWGIHNDEKTKQNKTNSSLVLL